MATGTIILNPMELNWNHETFQETNEKTTE